MTKLYFRKIYDHYDHEMVVLILLIRSNVLLQLTFNMESVLILPLEEALEIYIFETKH